jgi:hypothetical protein
LSGTVCLTTSTTIMTSDTLIKYQLNAHCFIHIFHTYLLHVSVLVYHHQGEQLCHLLEKPTTIMTHTVPDNVHHLHVQQPLTYEIPEDASAVLGSWWWAVCRPKHVELHIHLE